MVFGWCKCHLRSPHLGVIWRLLYEFWTGPRMASCDNFRIEVEGNLPMDPHLIRVSMPFWLLLISSPKFRLLFPVWMTRSTHWSATVGTIKCGQRFNILADKVVMEELLRTHQNAPVNRTFTPQNHRKYSGFHGCSGYPYIWIFSCADHQWPRRSRPDCKKCSYQNVRYDSLKPFLKWWSARILPTIWKVPGVFGLVGPEGSDFGLELP